uniref:J domain-containing protein n=1 Tax=viral metagenome TaxID=1070528 RepID=A0A6C0K8K0_9ZZZZ
MGNQVSQHIPEAHIRIYRNVCSIQSPVTRVQMLETLLQGQEYVTSAKYIGIYGPILTYMAAVRRGDPALLPGERQSGERQSGERSQASIQQLPSINQHPTAQQRQRLSNGQGSGQGESRIISRTGDPSQHGQAISFFSQCLSILGLQEEVVLDEKTLKEAYKLASLRSHPDKGGSEEAFDRVTRAYAYLGEILRRVRGGRSETVNVANESPATLTSSRDQTSDSWKMAEPVKLNPKSLNMETFNKVFEETRLPDPDGDGYGDWLKNEAAESNNKQNKFTGKFNRDVFNSAFESEIRSRATTSNGQIAIMQPQALMMAPTMGIELGREKPDDFTAANLNGLKYTDLKKAYTSESMFSHQVAGVQLNTKSVESARTERKATPAPLSDSEMAAVAEGERQQTLRQQQQAKRIVDEDQRITDHFQRLQRYVITNNK